MEECKCRNVPIEQCQMSSCVSKPLYLIGEHQLWVGPSSTVQEEDNPRWLLRDGLVSCARDVERDWVTHVQLLACHHRAEGSSLLDHVHHSVCVCVVV